MTLPTPPLSDAVLVKHTAAVHINNILTLNQRKIANLLLKNAYAALMEDRVHTISVRDLLEQLGWQETSHVTEMLKDDLRALNTLQLEWDVFKRDRKRAWTVTTFLADAKLEDGIISYTYSRALRSALHGPNIYARLNLLIQQQFKTKHALVLWEYLCGELGTTSAPVVTSQWMSLEDAKKLFGINGKKSYDSFKALRQKILEPSLEEINKKSEVSVTMLLKKDGHRVVGLCFTAQRNKKVEEAAIQKTTPEDVTDEEIESLGISQERIQRDTEFYGKERVLKAVRYTLKRIKDGVVINNVAAFYSVALKEYWRDVAYSKKVSPTKDPQEPVGPEIFVRFMKSIRRTLGASAYRTWFVHCTFLSCAEGKLVLRAPSTFVRDYIETHFSHVLTKGRGEVQSVQILVEKTAEE